MKSKERSWASTKESPIHEVKKDHEDPKSKKKKKKERNNNNNKEKRRGSRSGQRTYSKVLDQRTCNKDLGQTRGHAARISVRPEDMQQEESTSRPYVCSDF